MIRSTEGRDETAAPNPPRRAPAEMRRMTATRLVLSLALAALTACAAQRPATPVTPALRVVVPRDTPPYAFRRDGQLVGLEVDFARQMATALGRRLVLLEVDFTDVIRTVVDNRADLAMAGLTITPGRQVLVAFSDPYLHSGLVAGMRREDVARFKTSDSVLRTAEPIGVVNGTTADRFVREHAPSASVQLYPDVRAAMDELRQRRVRLVVHDAPVVATFAAADEANLGVLIALLDHEDLGWGMRRDDDALRSAVNGALARWRTDGTRDQVLGRWVPYWQRLESGAQGRQR